ncbi:MAG: hypothetical protein MR531_10525 [Lachnospiraceae bacterium]|nr:hypothetical protein [Lachnospiraceae bacterium]
MTPEDRALLNRINAFADNVLHDIDPQKTRISFQLEKLKPIMEEIAAETNSTVEDIFIKYMDLASEANVATQRKFQNTVGNMTQYGDVHDSFSIN